MSYLCIANLRLHTLLVTRPVYINYQGNDFLCLMHSASSVVEKGLEDLEVMPAVIYQYIRGRLKTKSLRSVVDFKLTPFFWKVIKIWIFIRGWIFRKYLYTKQLMNESTETIVVEKKLLWKDYLLTVKKL